MKFQDVLNQILTEWNKDPKIPVEKIIEKFSSRFNLTEEDNKDLQLSNQLIDEFSSMKEELQQAREAGISRQKFVFDKFESVIGVAPDEKKNKIIKSLIESSESLSDDEEIKEID